VEKVKIFAPGSTGGPGTQYQGWWEWKYICDGRRHFQLRTPCGVLATQCYEICEEQGPCDGSCSGAVEVAAEKLPSAAQETLGIMVPVPDGKLLVEQCSAPWLQHTVYFYRVLKAGEMVTPKRLANGHVIGHGECVEVIETRHNSKGAEWTVRVIVNNKGGEAIIEDGEKEARRQFARDQMNYLLGLGFSKAKAARIMKAAGPGQVKIVIEWLYQSLEILKGRYERRDYFGHPEEVSEEERFGAAIDALDVIIKGQGGSNNFGFGRMAAVLRALGLPDPNCQTAGTFWGVLNGAHMAILCGLPKRKFEQSKAK